jgi:hypothetical protein
MYPACQIDLFTRLLAFLQNCFSRERAQRERKEKDEGQNKPQSLAI